ncbi:short chain dehydrogenase [Burkholderia sp. D7]|nr:short chain dehydrogenase [Burkholderia sp. D7]
MNADVLEIEPFWPAQMRQIDSNDLRSGPCAEGAEVLADRRERAITQEADDLIREAGHADMLIANPDRFVPVVERDGAEMQRVIGQNCYSLHRLCRAALSEMLKRKHGKIVAVSGTAGLKHGEGRLALYGAAR